MTDTAETGWQLAPVDCTKAMHESFRQKLKTTPALNVAEQLGWMAMREAYRAALAAAPPPPAVVTAEVLDAALAAWHTIVDRHDYNERNAMLAALEAATPRMLGTEKAPMPADLLQAARAAFLDLVSSAIRWEEDVDGDTDNNGRTVVTVNYHATIRHDDLEALCEALGIRVPFGETAGQAITAAVVAADAAHVAEESGVKS